MKTLVKTRIAKIASYGTTRTRLMMIMMVDGNGKHLKRNKNGKYCAFPPNQGLGADSLFEDPDFPADRSLMSLNYGAVIRILNFKIDDFLRFFKKQ